MFAHLASANESHSSGLIRLMAARKKGEGVLIALAALREMSRLLHFRSAPKIECGQLLYPHPAEIALTKSHLESPKAVISWDPLFKLRGCNQRLISHRLAFPAHSQRSRCSQWYFWNHEVVLYYLFSGGIVKKIVT